jgi:hypothetical protein
MMALAGKPTRGSHHGRAAQPNKENVRPAERRSKRQKQSVNYCEQDAAESDVAVEPKPCAQYSVPQCTAHGRFEKKGHRRAVTVMQRALSEEKSDLCIMLEWGVALTDPSCNRVDRANGTARRGDQKGQSSGQFMSGERHRVDVVLAQIVDGYGAVALTGLEVQGSSHKDEWTKLRDAEKSEYAGFPIWSVEADATEEELQLIIEGMLAMCN